MWVEVAGIDPTGRDRVVVRVADGSRIALSRTACVRLKLAAGRTVDDRALRAVAAEEAALRLLTLRARSRADLERRLSRRFPPEAVATAMARVAAHLDDEAFARDWVATRVARRPQGRTALLSELRRQGVRGAAAAAAVAEIDEAALVEAATEAVLRRLRGQPAEVVLRRLGAALSRRGFAVSVIRRVLRERFGDDGGASWSEGDPEQQDE